MGGKGRWADNVFVERLWRNVRYEEMYLHACESVAAARAGGPLLPVLQCRASSPGPWVPDTQRGVWS